MAADTPNTDGTSPHKKELAFKILAVICVLNWLAFCIITYNVGGTPNFNFMLGISRYSEFRVLDEDGNVKTVDNAEYKRLQREEGRYFLTYRRWVTEVGAGTYYFIYVYCFVSVGFILITMATGAWLALKKWTSSEEFMSAAELRNRGAVLLDAKEKPSSHVESIQDPVARRTRQDKLGCLFGLAMIGFFVAFYVLLLLRAGCNTHTQEVRVEEGSGGIINDTVNVAYHVTDRRINFLLFINLTSSRITGASGESETIFRARDYNAELRYTMNAGNDYLTINGKEYQLADGIAFMCDMKEHKPIVKQVSVQINRDVPSDQEIMPFVLAEAERLSDTQPDIRDYVKSGVLSDKLGKQTDHADNE
jgi:hypothetical protein